jgi:O-succinylbenzoic acid--CoA ligase
MGKILFKEFSISFESVKAGKWPSLKPYEEASLLFCQEWLTGKQTFQLQTSGSTGTPKTIQVRRSQMEASAMATGKFFQVQPDQHLLCCLNTFMIGGKMMLVRGMEWDSQIHVVKPSANPFLNFSPDQRVHFAALVPLQLEASLEIENVGNLLYQIKNLLIGGAPLAHHLREKAKAIPGNVYQTYGMTETVSHVALADIKREGALVYQALPGVSLGLATDHRLKISAPMSNHQWLLTNDIVEMVSPSSFVWKGRSDFIINSGGVKIQPEEVEANMYETFQQFFPGKPYLLTGLPDPRLGQKLVLLISGKAVLGSQPEYLLSALKNVLPAYHCPLEIHFLDHFSETASGKINRKETLNFYFKKVF